MNSNAYRSSISELGGGRIAILLLLFAIALYQFYSAGFGAFATICALPLLVIVIVTAFKYRMLLFWTLVFVNYLVSMKAIPSIPGIPLSLYNEVLEILLLMMAIIDAKEANFKCAANFMTVLVGIWCTFLVFELLNNTCGMMLDFPNWYPEARRIGIQIIYAVLVFTIYINTPQRIQNYLSLWGGLALFSVIWIWKQKYIGLTSSENAFLQGPAGKQHVLQNGALIRYFSIYSDAAAAGIGIASTAVAFIIFGITSKIKRYKYIFLTIGFACAWGMFPTGTRTAIVCFIAGFAVYAVTSKSVRMTVITGVATVLLFVFLAFTNIGNGNQMIRRMRSTFSKSDESAAVRDVNKEAMSKYMKDAPFGVGVGVGTNVVPINNKYHAMLSIPPDSEYVSIWRQTGAVGITIFICTTVLMFLGAIRIIMFKLTSSSLRGIGAGLASGFVAMQLGGYANQVLMQFPNCVTFYGGLSLVYVLPFIEKEWIEYENGLLALQLERERIKEEKKRASRV